MNIKQKIINAGIEVIEEEGIQSVTVRKVAKKAKVNIASINYYFGTKEKLISETLHDSLHAAFSDWNEVVGNCNMKLDCQLKKFFIHWISGIINYPNMTKAHLYAPIVNCNYKGLFVKHFNLFLENLHRTIKNSCPEMTSTQVNFTIMQIMSAVAFVSLVPNLFKSFSGIDLHNVKTQKNYIDHLINVYSKNYNFNKENS